MFRWEALAVLPVLRREVIITERDRAQMFLRDQATPSLSVLDLQAARTPNAGPYSVIGMAMEIFWMLTKLRCHLLPAGQEIIRLLFLFLQQPQWQVQE